VVWHSVLVLPTSKPHAALTLRDTADIWVSRIWRKAMPFIHKPYIYIHILCVYIYIYVYIYTHTYYTYTYVYTLHR